MPATTTPPVAPAAKPSAQAPPKTATTPPPQKPASPTTDAKPPASKSSPPTTERDPADWMGEVGADLDALSAEGDDKETGKSRQTPKPEEKKIEAPPEKEGGEEGATKPDQDKPESGEPVKLNDLRTAYSTLKKKVKEEYEPELQSLRSKVKELETTNPEGVKVIQEKLEASEKRREELEKRIEEVDFVSSDSYRKLQEPYIEAWAKARRDLNQVSVELPDNTSRKATDDDMLEIANLPLGAARRRAKELFGDAAEDMLAHRRNILDLAEKTEKAQEEAKAKAAETAKTRDIDRKAAAERVGKMWLDANKAVVEKWPKVFGEIEGDKEGNELLVKGRALADRLFSPTDETRPKTEEEAVRLHAVMAHKIANHDRLYLWLKRANSKIAELEKIVSDYEKSDPSGGLSGTSGSAPKSFEEEVNSEIEALDRKDL